MAHQAADSVLAWLALQGGGNPTTCILDSAVVARAKACLTQDAKGLLYSSTLSFVSAIEGAQGASFSWAIVKLYYACFYAARSILASNDACIFYIGSKPYSINLVSGAKPKKENGVTHKVVWTLFSREFPNNILLNEIDGIAAHAWMTRLRETANYKNAKFPDPLVPKEFAMIDSRGVAATLAAYNADTSDLFTFDRDHAVVAFPMKCISQARHALNRSGCGYDQDEVDHIGELCRRIGVCSEFLL